MKKVGFAVILFAIFLLGSISLLAQKPPNVENGFKHWGTYDGGSLDTINNLNGNQMLHAPLLPGYAGRGGLSVQDFLYQTSKTWQTRCDPNPGTTGGLVCYWKTQRAGVAWQQTPGLTMHRTASNYGSGTGTSVITASGYSITSADGSTHQLYPVPGATDPSGEATGFNSIDATGYHVEMSVPDSNGVMTTATVTDRQSNQYVAVFHATGLSCGQRPTNTITAGANVAPIVDDAPLGDQYCPQAANAQLVTDRNGNRMTSYNGTGNIGIGDGVPSNQGMQQDTLGRVFPILGGTGAPDYTGCTTTHTVAVAIVVNYAAPDRSTQPLKFCYANFTIQTAFNDVGVLEAQSAPGAPSPLIQPLLVTVVLADGSKWTFDYDGYGNVTSVGLPTGGSISYTWATIAFPACSINPRGDDVSRAVVTRTVNDNNGHSFTWNYQWGTVANGSMTNTVTDPLGNDTVHVFTALDGGCGFYETRTQSFQGTGGARQLLKQVDTIYSSVSYTVEAAPGYALGDVVPTSIQTTTYPSQKVSKVTKTYTPAPAAGAPIPGTVATEKEYDWGPGTPGPLLKETDTTYQWQVNSNYLAAHLLDLPASVVVKDGNGNRVAETDYVYDESAYLTAANVSTQHVAPPNTVRGNLTTVKNWLNTNNSWITTHTNWYDTGEPYQEIDASGNATTHTYASTFVGAYPTQSCNALNQCVSASYDFNTGVMTSFTDANSQSSNFTYDFLWRMTQAQGPPEPANNNARATTTFTFSAPNSYPLNIQRQRSITSTISDTATAYFDGLGRGYQGTHATPVGTVYTDTTFDGLGHVASVSNPYYTTTDATYGTVQTQYDGLGRATQVTKQDGSISTVSYTDNCTIATDEAGKQRRACSDALGRLTSVDEPGDSTAGASPVPNAGGTGATGYVTISGSEQWRQVPPSGGGGTPCPPRVICDPGGGGGYTYIYDGGTVSINISGHVYTAQYNASDTSASIATNLAAAVNADSSCPATASSSAGTVYLLSRATGSQVSYSLSSSWTWDTVDFTGPSFTAAGPNTISGGTDGPPVFGGHTYTTLYSYDTLGNLLQVTQQGGTTDQTKWRVRTFTYDSLGRLLTANNPESGTISYSYDVNGNVLTKTDARSVATTYSYDALNRITYKSHSDGTPPVGYGYDQTSFWGKTLQNTVGRLTAEGNGTTGAVFSYDVMGRLANQWSAAPSNYGGVTDPTVAAYDLAGNLTSLSYPSGRVVKFAYNSADQLNNVQFDNWAGTPVGYNYWSVNNANFYASGAPKLATLGNGVVESIALNKRLQPQQDTVSNSSIGTLADHVYSYGTQNNGNILSVTDQLNSARTQTFTYDQLNRLATAGESRWGLSFTYDPWGNFLQQALTSGWAYQHQYTALTNNRLSGYSYDAAGNLLNDGFHPYVYDGENRITQVGSGGATYTYDAEGNRVRKDVSGSPSTEYVYFGGNVVSERNVTTGAWSDYIFANGKRIAKADDFEHQLHVSGQVCATCGWQWYQWVFNNTDWVAGHLIQSGDSLRWKQWQNSGTQGGLIITFTDGTDSCCTGTTVADQNGGGIFGSSVSGQWQYRAANLTPVIGKTISQIRLIISGSSSQMDTYFQDVVFTGADGTIEPLFSQNPTAPSLSPFGSSGWTQTSATIHDCLGSSCAPSNTTTYYHGDQIGSSRLLTAGAGYPVWQGTFLPYGEEYNPQITTNHYKFTGKERDSESGLDYFGARYYGSGLGRFVTPDWAAKPAAVPYAVLGDPQSLNLYGYVLNNPLSHRDADGHCDISKGWCQVLNFIGCFCQPVQPVHLPPSAANAASQVANKVAPLVGKLAPVAVAMGLTTNARADQLKANQQQGKDFEQSVKPQLETQQTGVQQQVTVKTESGVKTRVDFAGKNESGQTVLTEAKSSATAPLTANQTKAFPEIQQTGATVVGQGKPGFAGGTKIAPAEVEIIRPPIIIIPE